MKSTLFGLEHCAKQKHDIELAMQFRLMRYRAYFIHHMPVPHLEDSITYFLDEIDKSGNLLLKADVLQELSDYYTFELQETGTGFGYMLKAYNIYKNIPASEFPQKYFCLYRLAGIYYRFQDYEQAKRLCMEAKSIPRYVIPDFFNVLNLMGMCYRNMGIYDSAVACFKEAYYGADSMHKTAWMGILSGNIGITYYYQGRYTEAIPLLKEDIHICTENRRALENVPKSMVILADAYLHMGQKDTAIALLQKANDLIAAENQWDLYERLQSVYAIEAKTYFSLGQKDKAYAFLDSAQIKKERFYKRYGTLILAGAERKVELENRREMLTRMRNAAELQKTRMTGFIVVLVLFAGLVILFINRQRIVHRRRSENAEAEKQKIETELANAKTMLDGFMHSVHEKNELIEKFTAELDKLQNKYNGGVPEDYTETLTQLQQSIILTDEQWESFRNMFEKVHAGYLQRLKMKLPGLSPAETRIMALSKLKLSNKEMAGMLGVSPDAVRMSKHRLRKKLDLSEEKSIDELADEI